MSHISSLLSGLENKIKKLVEFKQELEKKQQGLLSEKNNLLNIVEQQKQEIKQLKEQNDVLTLAKSVDLGEDKEEMKKKINQLVRDVNKCIAYLNQ